MRMGLDLSRKQALEAYGPVEVYEPNPRSVWGYAQGLTRLSQRTPWPFGELRASPERRPRSQAEAEARRADDPGTAGRPGWQDARFTLDQAASRLLATVH